MEKDSGDVELQPIDQVEVVPQSSLGEALEEADDKVERRTIMMRAIIFMAVVLVIVLLLAGIVATLVSIGVINTNGGRPNDPAYYDRSTLLVSVEFQIALNPKEDWTDRSGMLEHWLWSINRWAGPDLFVLKMEDADEMVYGQHHIDASTPQYCDADEDIKIRTRTYRDLNSTTIDIKHEEDINKPGACGEPFWPAENYLNVSRQKCEEDVHPCFNKFARATTVAFDGEYNKTWSTCGELKEIFPDAFPTITADNYHNPVHLKKEKNYWRLQWKGMAGNSTHWELTFGIEYDSDYTVDEILAGQIPIEEGEFSLRFYPEQGTLREPDVQLQLQNIFYHLVIEYDTYVDHVMCAYEYFLGQADSDIGYH